MPASRTNATFDTTFSQLKNVLLSAATTENKVACICDASPSSSCGRTNAALDLMTAFMKRLLFSRTLPICVICIGHSPAYWHAKLKRAGIIPVSSCDPSDSDLVVFIDCWKDPYAWLYDNATSANSGGVPLRRPVTLTAVVDGALDVLLPESHRTPNSVAYVVDDLLSLVNACGQQRTMRWLSKLPGRNVTLVRLRTDPHATENIAEQRLLCSMHSTFQIQQISLADRSVRVVVTNRYGKPSSLSQAVRVTFDLTYGITVESEEKEKSLASAIPKIRSVERSPLPGSQIDGGLKSKVLPEFDKFSAAELEARRRVRLPHERMRDDVLAGARQAPAVYGEAGHAAASEIIPDANLPTTAAANVPQRTGADIIYMPDARDDIDYEDPDDDLDI